tara:strand:- start:5223 stop:6404 length:1182 start_codon:yes stop_codon:yes gene_type:complete
MSEMITTYFSNIANGLKSFLTGLSLTLDHMKNKKENVATLQYPHEKFPVPEKNIGFEPSEYNVIRSRLHVDIDDCISCRMCERACPVDCIKIEDVKAKKGIEYDYGQTSNETRKKLLVTRFTIDMSECMYCNLCVYPCPEECIYMVGGPNEEKHEIDYEFSQYKRDGMIFDFAKASTDDLMEIGAEDYLKKVKEKQEKITKGERLLGLEVEKVEAPAPVAAAPAPAAAAPVAAPVAAAPVDNLTIKCVDIIEDIKLRAAAKKVFFKSKKAGDDDALKIDKILAEIKSLDGFNADIEQKLVALKPAPVAAAPAPAAAAPVAAPVAAAPVIKELFNIKELNDIEDIKTRAGLKKIYMQSKKSAKSNEDTLNEMIAFLENENKIDDTIKSKLDGLR